MWPSALQFVGRQFDDDLNVRAVPGQTDPGLPGFVTADFRVSRDITRNFDVFVGVQNLFDEPLLRGHAADDHRHAAPGPRRLPLHVREVVGGSDQHRQGCRRIGPALARA